MNKTLLKALPKAELHLHIEGSLEPEMLFTFAERNHIKLPFVDTDAVRKAYQFNKLQDFLDIYYQGMNVLRTADDFYELTSAYLQKMATENVVHCEIFFDPQGHTERGILFETIVDGISAALKEAEHTLGITSRLIMCFLRHLDEGSALKTFTAAEPYFHHTIHGVGLDSTEKNNPPHKFINVFKKAREAGLKCVAHAGEEGPPEYIWQALLVLGVERIDHGNRALEDKELSAKIAADKMPMTLCPLSNLKLCVVDDLVNYPIRTMLANNMLVCINSDDPSYFGGYLSDNFTALDDALNLTDEEMITLVKNGFSASFLPLSAIKKHHQKIDELTV